jgi:hypothetical protein
MLEPRERLGQRSERHRARHDRVAGVPLSIAAIRHEWWHRPPRDVRIASRSSTNHVIEPLGDREARTSEPARGVRVTPRCRVSLGPVPSCDCIRGRSDAGGGQRRHATRVEHWQRCGSSRRFGSERRSRRPCRSRLGRACCCIRRVGKTIWPTARTRTSSPRVRARARPARSARRTTCWERTAAPRGAPRRLGWKTAARCAENRTGPVSLPTAGPVCSKFSRSRLGHGVHWEA